MSDSSERHKGPPTFVAELLLNKHTRCLEELGAFIIAYAQINRFVADLKRGTASVKAGKTGRGLLDEYFELYESMEPTFERACTDFLSAEWPKFRTDIWDANDDKLRAAVTEYTEKLTRLLGAYKPS